MEIAAYTDEHEQSIAVKNIICLRAQPIGCALKLRLSKNLAAVYDHRVAGELEGARPASNTINRRLKRLEFQGFSDISILPRAKCSAAKRSQRSPKKDFFDKLCLRAQPIGCALKLSMCIQFRAYDLFRAIPNTVRALAPLQLVLSLELFRDTLGFCHLRNQGINPGHLTLQCWFRKITAAAILILFLCCRRLCKKE